ncbi:transposase [Nocardia fusca]|uniref:Transposase n=1 Tax=Nocardia fusca TaxID=941183 RepID=A0ABV3FI06_9NOCA
MSTDLTANQATDVLRRVRPSSPVERARKELARELVADVRAFDARLKANQQRMQDTVADSGSSLLDVVGVGPLVASRLLGRTGRASRFRTAGAFAVHTGTAPIEIASAGKSRHRLSRHGDRQLNNALHTIALTQVRMPGTRGRIYYDGKVAEGKGHKEAMRCLKRLLCDHVRRSMVADEQRHTSWAGPGGHSGATTKTIGSLGWVRADFCGHSVISRRRPARGFGGPRCRYALHCSMPPISGARFRREDGPTGRSIPAYRLVELSGIGG